MPFPEFQYINNTQIAQQLRGSTYKVLPLESRDSEEFIETIRSGGFPLMTDEQNDQFANETYVRRWSRDRGTILSYFWITEQVDFFDICIADAVYTLWRQWAGDKPAAGDTAQRPFTFTTRGVYAVFCGNAQAKSGKGSPAWQGVEDSLAKLSRCALCIACEQEDGQGFDSWKGAFLPIVRAGEKWEMRDMYSSHDGAHPELACPMPLYAFAQAKEQVIWFESKLLKTKSETCELPDFLSVSDKGVSREVDDAAIVGKALRVAAKDRRGTILMKRYLIHFLKTSRYRNIKSQGRDTLFVYGNPHHSGKSLVRTTRCLAGGDEQRLSWRQKLQLVCELAFILEGWIEGRFVESASIEATRSGCRVTVKRVPGK